MARQLCARPTIGTAPIDHAHALLARARSGKVVSSQASACAILTASDRPGPYSTRVNKIMSLVLTLASRNLFQDRLRFIATLIGIVFSVVLVMVGWGSISVSAAWSQP
jgi:hypothetical protein